MTGLVLRRKLKVFKTPLPDVEPVDWKAAPEVRCKVTPGTMILVFGHELMVPNECTNLFVSSGVAIFSSDDSKVMHTFSSHRHRWSNLSYVDP